MKWQRAFPRTGNIKRWENSETRTDQRWMVQDITTDERDPRFGLYVGGSVLLEVLPTLGAATRLASNLQDVFDAAKGER